MRKIAWLSEKGGVGKSTCAINTAAGLARRGSRVLLVDADPQANATLVLTEGKGSGGASLSHVLLDRADAEDAIISTRFERLDLLPSDGTLADANVTLAGELGRERRLAVAMRDVEKSYDFIIVDTSPARSLVNVNVLCFVEEVYCPIDPGLFALAGLAKLQDAIEEVRKYLDNARLKISGLVLTRAGSNNLSRDVEARLREMFGPLVMATTIPENIRIGEAHGLFLPVLDHSPKSAGAKAYESLTTEILSHGRETTRTRPASRKPASPDHAA